jgi:hypothetical protein
MHGLCTILYVRWLAEGLSFEDSSRTISIAFKTCLYPWSSLVENFTIPTWSAWIVSRRSRASPIIADSLSTTTWLTRINCQIAWNVSGNHTFPTPLVASSSTNDQTVNVRLSNIRLKLSLIRSRVCESLSRSRIRLTFVLRKAIWATEAINFASEVIPLPLWGVPRKIIPLVDEKMWPRWGWVSPTLMDWPSA